MMDQPVSTNNTENNRNKPRQQEVGKIHLNMDGFMIVSVIFLLVFGLLMVYSASWSYAIRRGETASYVLTRQLLWGIIGISVAFVLSRLDYHVLQKICLPLMGVMLFMLIAVLIINDNRFGSSRTLMNGSIQPSELAKLITIIYLSVWLYSKNEQLNNIWFGLTPLMLILGITSALIFLQPDLSATATIIILGGLLFFLAGGDIRQIILVIAVSALVGLILFNVTPVGKDRLNSYVEGREQLDNASYHVKRSIEAIVRGDVFGVGIGKGQSKFTGLPVPWTDSIFAIIIEETGLMGASFVILLYMLFLWRGLFIAQRAPDQLGKLLASGITLWIIMEALINMGGMINLLPFPGNALPLISSGGSSLVTDLIGIGIILSVSHTTQKSQKTNGERRLNGAVVDMRRRDRRGSVSRDVRPATKLQ